MRIVAGDIGGTNARFAIAEIAGRKVVSMSDAVTLATADHPGIASAWNAFRERLGGDLPRHAAFGLAGPVTGGPVRFVNSGWIVDPRSLAGDLRLERFLLLNDFGAMAHAVDALGPEHFAHLCGPDTPLPQRGAISVIGPGTGLGVAVLQRLRQGSIVLETEGSHIQFAPLDETEASLSAAIASEFGRTSVERIVSGPGLGAIVRCLHPGDRRSDAALWASAAAGGEQDALGLFLGCFGAVAGDLSLAHGSFGVAITGGLSNRIRDAFAPSRFHDRFCAKGRYRARMEAIPVRLLTHPEPGLFGAAAAFARETG